MKKIVCLIAMVVFLTGCSKTVWETVDDGQLTAASMLQQMYQIEVETGQELTLLMQGETGSIYTTANGEMEVETVNFVASNVDTAAKMLSGISADSMTVLQTQRFGLDEYQFAWVSHTEQGERLSRADLIMDGINCYAVVCSTLADAGNAYEEDLRHVFATFSLAAEEGV